MPQRILIVDDEVTEFAKYQLALEPFPELELIHAHSGPEALAEIDKSLPDLLFLDQVFYAKNIGIEMLYGIDLKGHIKLHVATTNPEDVVEDELKQGLYIFQKLRSSGCTVPVIFVTRYVDRTGQAGEEALKHEAQDYISKDRISREGLIPKIDNALHISLSTLEEKIASLVEPHVARTPEDEKAQFIPILAREARARRRRGLDFVKDVIELLSYDSPTIGDLSRAIREVSSRNIWESELVNPVALFEWVLRQWRDLDNSLADVSWGETHSNGIRYCFTGKLRDERIMLKIVHPQYSISPPIHLSPRPFPNGLLPVKAVHQFSLNTDDPGWKGTNVVAYVESVPDGISLRQFAVTRGPLAPEMIRSILQNIANLVKEVSDGHGMLDLDSIYIRDDGVVTICDVSLWDYITAEGRRESEYLTLEDRRNRDLQSLGLATDALLTGHAGGLQSLAPTNTFFAFVQKCLAGSWDLNDPIPVPTPKTRFFHFGPFRSGLERIFFYRLKSILLQNNIESIVFLNTRIKLPMRIPREVDALIVLPGKAWWVDTKGARYFKKDDLSKCQDLAAVLANELKKSAVSIFVEGRVVMDAADYGRTVSELNTTEKDSLLTIDEVLRMISSYTVQSISPPTALEDVARVIANLSLTADTGFYEDTPEFETFLGKKLGEKKGNLYDEVTTLRYYLKRYNVGHVTDPYYNIEDIRSLFEEAESELELFARLGSEHFLLPESVILLTSDLEQLEWKPGDYPESTVRWMYKVYRKPKFDTDYPLTICKSVVQIDEKIKESLARHYLQAVSKVLKQRVSTNFNKWSLKAFPGNQEWDGVLEINYGSETMRLRDIAVIFECLGNGSGPLNDFKRRLISSGSADTVSLVETFIRELEEKEETTNLRQRLSRIEQGVSRIENTLRSVPQLADTERDLLVLIEEKIRRFLGNDAKEIKLLVEDDIVKIAISTDVPGKVIGPQGKRVKQLESNLRELAGMRKVSIFVN